MRSLLIAVRFHEGRYHGQGDGFDGAEGWPPSPSRLFQALVAAAADGAAVSKSDEIALKWLEALPPPKIVAPAVRRGRAVKVFVPNNDLDAVGGDPARVSEIRVAKQWKPSFFDPDQPVLYAWTFEPGEDESSRICEIAERLYQLGRSIDVAWAEGRVLETPEAELEFASHPGPIRFPTPRGNVKVPSEGTFDSLGVRYRGRRQRLETDRSGRRPRQLFRQPPKALFRHAGYDAPVRPLHFDLRDVEGRFAPQPLSRSALVAAVLRDSAADRLKEQLPEQSGLFDRLIIGRDAGPKDIPQRIRVIPIPSIGAAHTDPSIRRILVEIPPNCPIPADDLAWAFSGLQPYDPRTGEAWAGQLVASEDDGMARRFWEPARRFKSITPLALGARPVRSASAKFGEARPGRVQQEQVAAAAVVQALRHASVLEPPTSARVQREPFDRRGYRAEAFSDGTRFHRGALWHATITFANPVSGPLVLGNGRFLGLGLMRPDDPTPGILALAITAGLADANKPDLVARAARRAMMARVQEHLPRGESIPAYVSGHGPDGKPLRDGDHRHIAVVADLPRNRILFVGAHLLQRRGVPWRRVSKEHRLAERSLEGMEVLHAGEVGRLALAPTAIDAAGDPLFAPAPTWESVTDYHVTRHSRRLSDEEAIKADVHSELRRCGWPEPKTIEALRVRCGPRGGVSGRLRISFAQAEPGPLILGRNSHKGGGLFAGGA